MTALLWRVAKDATDGRTQAKPLSQHSHPQMSHSLLNKFFYLIFINIPLYAYYLN